MERRIYLDHAATTPMDREVFEYIAPYFVDVFGNADSPHAVGRKAMGAVDRARDTVAELIHAKASEVYFTSGGTEADNWAILGGARAKRKESRTQVIVSAIEHHAALFAAETLEKEGFEVVYLPVNNKGEVELCELEKVLSNNTALVAIMAANNETGVLQPVQGAAKMAHSYGALFFTDAVQAAPYMQINVQEWGVDMLSFSGHKFYGPKGCGVLYIKSGVAIEKLVGGGEQERGLRGGTLNVPSVVALAKAYEKTVKGLAQSNEKLKTLSASFMQEISVLEGVTRNGESENTLPSILNLRFAGVENTAFLYNMDLQGVCLAAGSACASASVKPSHVLTAMGLSEAQAKESVRFSLGRTNTEEEIKAAARLTVETVRRLRG
ncbi:MAG: cysteine desulfurase [Clostridia bacterium]|nr:cysteine desulfurase [Clostridia bacterium]